MPGSQYITMYRLYKQIQHFRSTAVHKLSAGHGPDHNPNIKPEIFQI